MFSTKTSGKAEPCPCSDGNTVLASGAFLVQGEASSHENTLKMREKRLIRQARSCTGRLCGKAAFDAPQLLTALPTPRGQAEPEGAQLREGSQLSSVSWLAETAKKTQVWLNGG